MIEELKGQITNCPQCRIYIRFDDTDVHFKERSYGVATYAGETYMAKLITCPKCGKEIEDY